jgi:hypothetical protein
MGLNRARRVEHEINFFSLAALVSPGDGADAAAPSGLRIAIR